MNGGAGDGDSPDAIPVFAIAAPGAILVPMPTLEINTTQPWLISYHSNVAEIIGKFGGADQLRNAVNQLQSLLYRPMLDTLHFFDNSSDTPRLIFKEESGQTTIGEAALYEQLRREFAP